MTLRKKQCERHVRGECSPGSLTCIDCSKNFPGTSYKSHATCISEQDKHWGEFAPSRKPQPPIRIE
jgi:cell growth-regulating nucleolar protein